MIIFNSQVGGELKNRLETNSVVSVKVIERNGDRAGIDVNGVKIEATIETDTPDSFLAYIEKEGGQFKLRVLSSFKQSPDFQAFTQMKSMEKIRDFLLGNQLPINDRSVEIAMKMMEAGVKLDKNTFRVLNTSDMKSGNGFTNVLLSLMQRGLSLDLDFAGLIFELKEVYKELLKTSPFIYQKDKGLVEPKKLPEETGLLAELAGFFRGLFSGPYEARYIESEKWDFTAQARKEKNGEQTRYYFDISSQPLGDILIVIDSLPEYYRVAVKLNEELYRTIDSGLNKKQKSFNNDLGRMTGDKKILVTFHEMTDSAEFFRMPQGNKKENITNLDIFA